MTKIDPHGEALDLLHDERDALESALRDVKPKINALQACYQSGDKIGHDLRVVLWNGNISRLTKHRNDLQRRLKNVEETRKLLKEDRAMQLQDEWDHEQWVKEVTEGKIKKPVMQCGCW